MSGLTNPTSSGEDPGTQPDTNTTPPPVFTQEQVNSVAAKEKREGRKALATELETLTGFTLDELKALKKTQAAAPPATPAPASTPVKPQDEVLELVRAMAARQEALEAKLTQAETQKAQDALVGKAKAGGVWDQFLDKVTSEEAIEATLAMQKTILEQHGAGASVKKPAPTTNGGASSNVHDVATNDVMSPEDAYKKLQELGGI